MKKFRVYARYDGYCYIDIEAETKEEAEAFAEEIDGGQFEPSDRPSIGMWNIVPDMTEEV